MQNHRAVGLTLLGAPVALLFGGCSATPPETVGHIDQGVASGEVYNLGAIAHPGSCMDAQGGGTSDGTQIQEWTCNGTGAQSFELEDDGAGGFYIVNTQANKCVDVQTRGTANGTKVQLYDCNQSVAQTFTVADAGGGFVSFINTNSGKCLDVAGDDPADGTVVQLYDCNGTSAQKWNPTVIGITSSSGSGGASSSGGASGALATCDAAQRASCNCPSTFSCCPTDGSCFQSADQIVYTMCKSDPSSACSMSGSSSTPTPTPTPTPSSNGGRTFTFQNHCGYDVWVGGEGNPIAPPVPCSAGCPMNTVCNAANQLCTFTVPSASNWEVAPGQSMSLSLPPAWGGRFWPRTECATANGRTTCATGDCAANMECPIGVGGAPPATLAEFTVTPPSGGSDFYDVSNVDGSNVPLSIAPTPGTFDPTPPPGANVSYYCQSPGCTSNCGGLPACSWNLPSTCPPELQDQDPGHYVGCRSANQVCAVDPSNAKLDCANEDDLYGCTGGGPNGVSGSCYTKGAGASCCGCPSWSPSGACQSTNPRWAPPSLPGTYAQVLKDACPTAYSFPYDDLTSTFTCQGSSSTNTSYTITFCP